MHHRTGWGSLHPHPVRWGQLSYFCGVARIVVIDSLGYPVFFFFFISLAFYIGAIILWQKAKRFNENCTKTTGHVVSMDEKGNDLIIRIEYKDTMNKSYIHVIEKKDAVGRQKRLGEKLSDDPRFQRTHWKIGETIDLFYNRDKPEDAIPGSPKWAYSGALMCAIFASFPMVFVVIPSLF